MSAGLQVLGFGGSSGLRRPLPKRKQRDDEDSSDSPLTKAARACRDAGDTTAPAGDGLGDRPQDSADGVVGLQKKLHWRKVRRVNAQREAKVGRDVLQTIQSSLGRAPTGIRGSWRKWKSKAAQPAVRKVRAGSYTAKFMIEMALPETKVGNGALKHEPLLPSVNKQAGMSGVSNKTMLRARHLAVYALADATEKCLSSLASSAGPARAVKVSWDETALRFYCPEETLKCMIGNMHVHPRRVVSRRRRRADGSGGQ